MAAEWNPNEIPAHLWRLTKRCACGGIEKWRYARIADTRIELQVMPTRYLFRIIQSGTLTTELPLKELHTYLSQYENQLDDTTA
jgi:hypothetical protein